MDKKDNGSWAIGGCLLVGVGVGFVFLQTSVYLFIASILIGLGAGLVIASFIRNR